MAGFEVSIYGPFWVSTEEHRGRRLRVALWFLELRPAPGDAALAALHSWLDSWMGIDAVTAGTAHQGYDLQLTHCDARGWRASRQRHRALDYGRHRLRVRALTLVRDPARGTSGARPDHHVGAAPRIIEAEDQ